MAPPTSKTHAKPDKMESKSEVKPKNHFSFEDEVDLPRSANTAGSRPSVDADDVPMVKSTNHITFSDIEEEEINHKQSTQNTNGKRPKSSLQAASKKQKIKDDARPLTFKSLAIGTSVVCAVKEIKELELIVALPFNIIGVVPITQISDKMLKLVESVAEQEDSDNEDEAMDGNVEGKSEMPNLNEYFFPGQLLRAVVTEKSVEDSQKKRVELSLNPSHVQKHLTAKDLVTGLPLQVAVESVEDHGVIVQVGIEGLTGFIPSDESLSSCKSGQILAGNVVVSKVKGRTVQLSMKQPLKHQALKSSADIQAHKLKAGFIVNASVTSVTPSGLKVKFLDYYEGQISYSHAAAYARIQDAQNFTANDLGSYFSEGQKLTAKIIYALPKSGVDIGFDASEEENDMKYGLSLLPHILDNSPLRMPDQFQIGMFIENATVTNVQNTHGVYFDVPLNSMCFEGFVHISRCFDERVNSLEGRKVFQAGLQHRARVIDIGAFDGIIYMSLEKAVLEATYMRYSDIQPGQIVKDAVVTKLDEQGNLNLLLCKTGNIRAYCPSSHLSDISRLQHPEKKFKVGGKVNVRILTVDHQKKKILVTCKPSLVSSNLPIIYNLEQVKNILQGGKQVQTIGVISGVKPYGCFVTFYNNLKGFLHVSQSIERSTEGFSVGQIIKCYVTGVDDETSRVSLATDLKGRPTEFNSSEVSPGQLLHNCRVTGISTNGKGFWIESQDPKAKAYIPLQHGSDMKSIALPKVDEDLGTAVITHIQTNTKENEKTSNTVVASLKPILVKAAELGLYPANLEKAECGTMLTGYIRRIDENLGVFVDLGASATALCPKKYCSDLFVKSLSTKFEIGQSVLAMVKELDIKNQKVIVSLRISDLIEAIACSDSYPHFMACFSKQICGNEDYDNSKRDWSIDHEIEGVGYICKSGEMHGVLTRQHSNGIELQSGAHLTATVLDFDSTKNVADLSLKPSLMANEKTEKTVKKVQKMLYKELEAVVELVKPSYSIVSLRKYPSILGKVATVLPNDSEYPIVKMTPGKNLKVILTGVDTSGAAHLVLIPEKETKKSQRDSKMGSKSTHSNVVDDENIKDISDYKVGALVKGVIKSIKNCQANVLLSRKHGESSALIEGRIHVAELFDDMPVSSNVFEAAGLKSGMVISAKVIGFSSARTHKWLPFSHAVDSKAIVELSIRPTVLNGDAVPEIKEDQPLPKGMIVCGAIQEIIKDSKKYALKVILNRKYHGRVQIVDVSNEVETITAYRKHFAVGQSVRCAVVDQSESDLNAVELTMRIFEGEIPRVLTDINSIIIGDKVSCKITGVNNKGINVIVSGSVKDKPVFGLIPVTEIAKEFEKVILNNFQKDHYLSATVFESDQEQNRVLLTLRNDKDNIIRGFDNVTEGDIVEGFISNISANGIFINIGNGVSARVKIGELSDDFIKEWNKKFKIGQVVKCKIQNVDSDGQKIEATMKLSELDPESYLKLQGSTAKLMFDHLEVGQVLNGTVVQIQDKAVLIDLDNTQSFKKSFAIRGRCHISEMTDEMLKDIASQFEIGDRVKCIILSVDHEKKHVNLGLKPSYFSSREEQGDISDSEAENEAESDDTMDTNGIEETFEQTLIDASEEEFEEEVSTNIASVPKSMEIDGCSSDEEKMMWDVDENVQVSDTENVSEDDANGEKQGKSKTRREKRRAKVLEEETIEQKERMLAAGETEAPEKPEDFERLLFASPNSSFLWIQYMAFFVNILDLNNARKIAERALTTINYREEKEKFNVWAAYLNLENKFGSPESLTKVFEKAIAYNEPKHIHLCLADIYLKTKKFEELENLFTSMLKKFKTSFKVWMYVETYYFKQGRPEEARSTLQRSLQLLPKHKHVKAVSRFAAQLEFVHGSVELGRTLMEGIVSNNSKRVDIWTIFVDMEIKKGNVNAARKLMERAIHMKLSSRKMKALFKKYLDLEKRFGNDETVQHVVKAATEYVESITENDE